MSQNQIALRAKANLPTVLLTLLSIVQALALELMWAHIGANEYLHSWSFLAVLGWMQLGTTLLGVLLVWLIYSGLVMRFAWVPSTTDSVFPFIVGIIEFAQIATLGVDSIGQWFLVLAVLFAIMSWVTQVTMKRARHDGANDDFFRNIPPATLRDLFLSSIPIVILVIIGVGLLTSGNQGWGALICVSAAFTLISVQLVMNHHYTQKSYVFADTD